MPVSEAKSSGRALLTGGAGYVGAVLTPRLLALGWRVRVLDWYVFGEHVLDGVKDHPNLEQIRGDIRDVPLLRRVLRGCDAVIHLACISNDPSFELNPELGRSVNYEAFAPLVRISRENGVRRFIYASSSSVYGISAAANVGEDQPLAPLTDYSKYKARCETILGEFQSPGFTTVVIRPATVCGYSPRQRLDLTVNILTNHAVNLGRIRVFGGAQLRPNIHIEDVTNLYATLLALPDERIAGKTYNAGYENHSIAQLAEMVRDVVEEELPEKKPLEIVFEPSADKRSYHISSEKIRRELGFAPRRTIRDAVRDLVAAFEQGKIPDPMTDPRWYNLKTLERLQSKLQMEARTHAG